MALIIAEAGVNHNGDKNLAYRLIDAAFEAGADIVKFQTFKAEHLASSQAEMASYQVSNTQKRESQLEMLKRLELPFQDYHALMQYADQLGIEFLSTAFDDESLKFLVNDLKLSRLKIPSGELTNSPLVLAHAKSGCDLILSTGMATLSDIEFALSVIAFGMTAPEEEPSVEGFQRAYISAEGQSLLREKVTILHCTTEYPAPLESINLRTMNSLGIAFGLPVGYSDHTEGVSIATAAVAMGATVIEKHFTLDKAMEGPDHKASLNPSELKLLVDSIRDVELAMGSGVKFPSSAEIPNMPIARKSLVINADLAVGDTITAEVLTAKRPGHGIPPTRYWDFIGKSVTRNYSKGELLDE